MANIRPSSSFGCKSHRRCIKQALSDAEQICLQRKSRLTPLRKRVLELVWSSHKPLGAYALLEQLSKEGHKPAPPTVYRALEFLQEQGLVHKVNALNAYMGCAHPQPGDHNRQLLICRLCGNVAELQISEIEHAIDSVAKSAAFTVEKQALEILGVCLQCSEHSL